MKESDMFKQEALDDDTLKNKFKGLILLKENIGLMVWYLLSGILSYCKLLFNYI